MFDLTSTKGVGIDLAKIDRFANKKDDQIFLKRIFTDQEIKEFPRGNNLIRHIASRWALKEAVSKALGCGIGPKLSWKDLETGKDINGKPYIRLSEGAYTLHQQPEIHASLSHDGDYVIAIAIVT